MLAISSAKRMFDSQRSHAPRTMSRAVCQFEHDISHEIAQSVATANTYDRFANALAEDFIQGRQATLAERKKGRTGSAICNCRGKLI